MQIIKNDCRHIKIYILRTTAVDPEPRLEKVASWLAEKGFGVTVLGWDREKKSKQNEIVGEIIIERSKYKGGYGYGIGNLIGLIQFNVHLLIRLFKGKPDIVHACDLDTAFPGLIYCKLTKKRIVYDIFDFYAESRRVGRLKEIIRKFERWVCTRCDSIIIVHEKRIEQIEPLPEHIRKRVEVIYNTPEEITVRNTDSSNLYFCYVGVLHNDRGIKYAIEAIKQIPELKFIYAGYGPLENELARMSSDANNIEFLGRINYKTALEIEAGAIAIIAFYDSSLGGNNLYAAPNKLFEALMLGKPLITSEGTLLADIVKMENIGYVVPYGNEELLRQTLLSILSSPEEAKLKGKRARELYDSKYSAKIAKERLLDIYSKIIQS